jgi:hypothetical protein
VVVDDETVVDCFDQEQKMRNYCSESLTDYHETLLLLLLGVFYVS